MKINILIINYQSRNLLEKCLLSINEDKIDFRIFILNNDRKDLVLPENLIDKNINIINKGSNLGFSKGINYLIKNIPHSEYFFLLNPDATISKNVIYDLYESIKSNDDFAAISPFIYDINDFLWFNYGHINWSNYKIENKNENFLNYNHKYEIDVFNGCATLIKTSAFKKSGMFLDNLFMYYDEAFLSMSFKLNGYKIYCKKVGKITHNISYSTKNNEHIKIFYMVRNGFYFFYKYNPFFKNRYILLNIYLYRSIYYIKKLKFFNFYIYYKALFRSFIFIKKNK